METIDEIRELWKRRQAWHRAEKSLTLQAKASCRRLVEGDKGEADKLYKAALKGGDHPMAMFALAVILPFEEASKVIRTQRKEAEKRLEKLAATLPESEWVAGVRGFGMLGFAGIIGEAGALTNYANPGKLWKRMGLAVMPDGGRQRRVTGVDALEHGYSPTRRSLVWTLGDSMFKGQSGKVDSETGEVLREAGEYRQIYDARKAYEVERDPEIKPIVAHLRAKRYMEKRLLRNLWRVARDKAGIPDDEILLAA